MDKQYTVFVGETENNETVTLFQNEKMDYQIPDDRRLPPIEGKFQFQIDDGDVLELSPDAEITLADFGDYVELTIKSAEWTGTAKTSVEQQ